MSPRRVQKGMGLNVALEPSDLERHDVVITTLQTLTSEWKNHVKTPTSSDDEDSDAAPVVVTKKPASVAACALYGVKWLRVIVGECVALVLS